MAKTHTLGVRLDPDEKAAVEALAAAETRAVAAMLRILVREALAARERAAVRKEKRK